MSFLDGLALPSALKATGWLAQLAGPGIDTPEEAALVFSGPQFFIALLSGVILAFGFQMLLTNFAVAAGVSFLASSSGSSSSSSSDSSSSSGSGVKMISFALGLGTLLSVSASLFFACWLAVKLSLYNSTLLGAVTGLVIWGTYFTLLTWISSTTVGSLIGSVVKSATNGFQALVGTAAAAMGAKGASNQVVQTAEATAAAVRRELTAGLDTSAIQENLQRYLGGLSSPEADAVAVEREFERLIRSSDLQVVDGGSDEVTPELFERLLRDRTNVSKQESQKLAKRLYRVWQRHSNSSGRMNELMSFIASASAGQLASEGLGSRIEELVYELKQQRPSGQSGQSQDDNSGQGAKHMMAMGLSQAMNSAISMVLGKLDLQDVDANKIIGQLKSAQEQIAGTASEQMPQLAEAMSDDNTVKTDVEDYLRHAYIGELKSAELDNAFRNVLYDTEADATELREQLSGLNRKMYVDILSQRGFFTQDEIQSIATRLEVIRQAVLRDVKTAEKTLSEKRIRRQMETFFRYTPLSELRGDMGDRAFRAIIENEPVEAAHLRESLQKIDRAYIRQFIVSRGDLNAAETDQVADRYYQLMERTLADAEGLEASAKVRAEQQKESLKSYLRSTGKSELNPEGIKRDIQRLLDEPDEGIRRIRGRVSQFDRDTFVQLLSQRPEFNESDVNGVIDSVEDSWNRTVSAPNRISSQAQAKYDEATSAIADYLRRTGKPELSPEGIKRDIEKLLDNPKVGAHAIRFRLSKMDSDTLVKLLSVRDDMDEAEVRRTVDTVLSTIQSVIRSPRRFARRSQSLPGQAKSKALSFESALEDYLSNTDKSELNPNGIKRDLNTLLNDPKLGMSRLSDRVAQMDDSTMVALLAQRSDMTQEEAENVVAQIASARSQVMDQVRSVQQSVQSVIDRIFAQIRNYLNSLDRPELNYYGIQQDVQRVFDDPQAGFAALRDRLSQFDRNTLVALLSSHDRISERDVNRVIAQVESARDSVLQRAERMEQQIETRLASIKQQTAQQVEDTKKAAVAASWWLFGTALVSALLAAYGGSLAVAG